MINFLPLLHLPPRDPRDLRASAVRSIQPSIGNREIEYPHRKASTNPGLTYTPQFLSALGATWQDFTGSETKRETKHGCRSPGT